MTSLYLTLDEALSVNDSVCQFVYSSNIRSKQHQTPPYLSSLHRRQPSTPTFENDHIKKELQKPLQLFNTPLWTSLGLNQGPPDYESVALTN